MLPREITIDIENKTLSEFACKSCDTKGRDVYEEPCDVRTEFQRDRDRIIHCNAFRRLKHKTQVFLIPKSDHYRTRLTHTLEVAQIARTISRALRLNEDLTEAIALGHDLGHTPFGHDGERTLADLYSGGFKHYKQSVRVVERIERDGRGLNLTKEVKNGILCHTNMAADTLEGVVVKFADKIAYINHDIEDAIRAGVLKQNSLPEFPVRVLGASKSKRITSLVKSLVENSGDGEIRYDETTKRAHDELREFMFQNVYYAAETNQEKDKACFIVEYLYSYFMKNPMRMPELYREIAKEESTEIAVCDYISCMTDDFAIDTFTELCIPKSWNKAGD
ncbi:MAG: deoxyguanosinetriphosphate triphosphohydrolase [Ruminiclostridium sp.]|nr:deoxyguanosinetriphosphate triphosphohydrolase [Ruminiclostridium sp.]